MREEILPARQSWSHGQVMINFGCLSLIYGMLSSWQDLCSPLKHNADKKNCNIFEYRKGFWEIRSIHLDLRDYNMILAMEGFSWQPSLMPRYIATWISLFTHLTHRNASLP